MELNLGGKSVIVTGGGSNIGRAISLAFAREGAHLTVAEIDEGQGRKVVAEAKSRGAASATLVPTDVTRWESVQAMVREVEDRAGRVDVLVNNVGWTYDRLFVEKERSEWEREIQLNLWGMINCTRAVLDGMIARKAWCHRQHGLGRRAHGRVPRGRVRRVQGRRDRALQEPRPRGRPPRHPAQRGLSRHDHSRVGGGLRRAAACGRPRRIARGARPDMQARIAKAYPLRRIGKPEDVAPAVLFLASDAASFITGQTLSVSGGYTMM